MRINEEVFGQVWRVSWRLSLDYGTFAVGLRVCTLDAVGVILHLACFSFSLFWATKEEA